MTNFIQSLSTAPQLQPMNAAPTTETTATTTTAETTATATATSISTSTIHKEPHKTPHKAQLIVPRIGKDDKTTKTINALKQLKAIDERTIEKIAKTNDKPQRKPQGRRRRRRYANELANKLANNNNDKDDNDDDTFSTFMEESDGGNSNRADPNSNRADPNSNNHNNNMQNILERYGTVEITPRNYFFQVI
eukprot:992429_1